MKPKAVLAYCREKGIRAVDLRFTDIAGTWRHVTFPVGALTEPSFDSGFGHQVMLTGFHGDSLKQAILVPISNANYLDPLVEQPTLVILASVQDAIMREDSEFDPRALAQRASNFLASSGVGDGIQLRATHQFRFSRELVSTEFRPLIKYLACGTDDIDFGFRCDLTSLAAEAGINIERHYLGLADISAVVFGGKSLMETCDDLMMLRYLAHRQAQSRGLKYSMDNVSIPSHWQIMRNNEPLFSGTSTKGLSETGIFAVGGLLKHSSSIAAVAASASMRPANAPSRWLRACSESCDDSLISLSLGSHNPRLRSIEFRGCPVYANPYLVYSTILMAMIDGIQNKIPCEGFVETVTPENRHALRITPTERMDLESLEFLATELDRDREYLLSGNVFSDSLIQTVIQQLRNTETTT